MIRYIDSKTMGRSQLGWLDSHFHFSFANYYNPKNMNFGVLRVINDDLIQPHTGFDTHPHENMEIITYVVDGEVTHADSMRNQHTLSRGQVQYMSAGTGVYHSEHNIGDEVLRLLQIWILPDQNGYTPNYGDYPFVLGDRYDTWMPIASSYEHKDSQAPIRIHADINIFATILSPHNSITFHVGVNRQAYVVLIEGQAQINGIQLSPRDAIEVSEESITVIANQTSHILLIEMEKPYE